MSETGPDVPLAISVPGFFSGLVANSNHHAPHSRWYQGVARNLSSSRLDLESQLLEGSVNLGDLGFIRFGLADLGNLNSADLFGLDELILFAYYRQNVSKYKRFVDLGANVGLHSVVASSCGYLVEAFEPDPTHFSILRENMAQNHFHQGRLHMEAITSQVGSDGLATLVRVLGNTTSSHIAGTKESAYGPLEKVQVKSRRFSEIETKSGLVKVDIEGSEADLICNLSDDDFLRFDFFVEIGSPGTRAAIWKFLQSKKAFVRMFPQKKYWNRALTETDLPAHYTEGTLFISSQKSMEW